MKRREFITLLGGAVAAWPFAARAQQPAMPVIGLLGSGAPEAAARITSAFRKGLSEMGFVEGRNVTFEFRFASTAYDRLPELAADLVRRRVAVIATTTMTAALAAHAATTTIPIVFATTSDPVEAGIVASLNRPGGNVTGVTNLGTELTAKRVGLLHELVPGSGRFAVMINAKASNADTLTREVQAAAAAIGRQLDVLNVSTARELDAAFATLAERRASALIITPDTFLQSRRAQILTLAAYYRLPAIYTERNWVEAGGLISYGSNGLERHRLVGIYTGRILKGEKPSDLPVMQATRFEFVINLQTARTFGLSVPPTLLAIADEVIE